MNLASLLVAIGAAVWLVVGYLLFADGAPLALVAAPAGVGLALLGASFALVAKGA